MFLVNRLRFDMITRFSVRLMLRPSLCKNLFWPPETSEKCVVIPFTFRPIFTFAPLSFCFHAVLDLITRIATLLSPFLIQGLTDITHYHRDIEDQHILVPERE